MLLPSPSAKKVRNFKSAEREFFSRVLQANDGKSGANSEAEIVQGEEGFFSTHAWPALGHLYWLDWTRRKLRKPVIVFFRVWSEWIENEKTLTKVKNGPPVLLPRKFTFKKSFLNKITVSLSVQGIYIKILLFLLRWQRLLVMLLYLFQYLSLFSPFLPFSLYLSWPSWTNLLSGYWKIKINVVGYMYVLELIKNLPILMLLIHFQESGWQERRKFSNWEFSFQGSLRGCVLKLKSAKNTKWLGTDNTDTSNVQEKDLEIFKSSFEIRRCTSSLVSYQKEILNSCQRWTGIVLVYLYNAMWLVQKTCGAYSTNQMQNQTHSRLSVLFPVF